MGVRVIKAALLLYVLVAVAAPQQAAAAKATCSKGDTPCWCKSIGGTWRALQGPLLPACKVTYQHQGAERYVHIYLPPSYDGTTQWPVWVHLHGVFWATMGDIGSRVNQPVNGTDIIPAFDHSVEILGDKAILVYPQATGDAGRGTPDEGQGKKYRQFWNIPFWRCSVGICRDPSMDDMGFIEKVVADLPKRLPLKPGQYLLTGESAGGMMVHAILCQSKVIPSLVDAAIDMLGGVGADYIRGPKCASHKPIPFLKLHGVEDPFITYSKDILVDGVNFASSIEGVQTHAKANGCGPKDAGQQDVPEADGKMLCTDYCGGNPAKPPAKLCGMPGVGHDTDHPHPGFVYEQSWAWFQQQVKEAAGRKKKPAAAAAAPAAAEEAEEAEGDGGAAAAAAGKGSLELSITYPGAKLGDMKGDTAATALAAVSQATGLPAANITATYATAPAADAKDAREAGGSRRLLRLLLAAAASAAAAAPGDAGGVTGRYTLQASEPKKVAAAVSAAVKDGSLLQSLRKGGLAAAAASSSSSGGQKGPLVSLSAAAAADGAPRQAIIKATDLMQAAPAAAPEEKPAADSSSSSSSTDPVAAEIKWSTAPAGSAMSSATAAPAAAPSPPVGVIIGAVLGALAGAALLVGGAFWFLNRRKQQKQQEQEQQQQKKQQQEEQEDEEQQQAYLKGWEAEQQPQQQQQQHGVINLTADAVMCINDEDSVRKYFVHRQS